MLTQDKKVFANSHSLLSPATKIVGDLYFSGDFHLEGSVKGNIYAIEGKPAKLIVAETAMVEGAIYTPNAVINGNVVGTIHCSKHLELSSKAVVEGSVHYQFMEMVKGAQLIGQMVYSGPAKGQADSKTTETVKAASA